MPWPPRSLRDLGWSVGRLSTVLRGRRAPVPGAGRLPRPRRARRLGALAAGPGPRVAPARPHPRDLRRGRAPGLPVRAAPGPLPLPRVPALHGSRGRGGGDSRPWRPLGPAGGRRAIGVAAALCAALAVVGLLRDAPPYAPEPLKPALLEMRQAWQPGDRIYVYYGAEKAFVYYARRFGFAPGSYVLGICARQDPRLYLRELDAFRGAPRVWLVLAHPALGEDGIILGYLDRIGDAAELVPGDRTRARHARARCRARRALRSLRPRAPRRRHRRRVSRAAAPGGRTGRRLVLPPGRVAAAPGRRYQIRIELRTIASRSRGPTLRGAFVRRRGCRRVPSTRAAASPSV